MPNRQIVLESTMRSFTLFIVAVIAMGYCLAVAVPKVAKVRQRWDGFLTQAQGVHLKTSWIFTSNDMVANAGIVLSGVAIMIFASPLPDLIIGLLVVGIVLKGGWEILNEAREAEDPSRRRS